MYTLTITDLDKFLGDRLTADAVSEEGRQETQLLAGPNAVLNPAFVARRGLERVVAAAIDAIEEETGAPVDCDEDELVEALADRLGLRLHTPEVEVCTNAEWLGQLLGVEGCGREEAAQEWSSRVFEAVTAAGLEPVNAKGQRAMYHGWNGTQFGRRGFAGIGSFDGAITDAEWDALTDSVGKITEAVAAECAEED